MRMSPTVRRLEITDQYCSAQRHRPAVAGLDPGQAAAMLASCNRNTAAGRRDFAMLAMRLDSLGARVVFNVTCNIWSRHGNRRRECSRS